MVKGEAGALEVAAAGLKEVAEAWAVAGGAVKLVAADR